MACSRRTSCPDTAASRFVQANPDAGLGGSRHPRHDERLAAYWAEALGGPADYTARLGDQSMVTRMHSGNGQHEDMDRRALGCFAGALDDIAVGDPALREELLRWFAWAIERMGDYPDAVEDVPEGLAMQVWSAVD